MVEHIQLIMLVFLVIKQVIMDIMIFLARTITSHIGFLSSMLKLILELLLSSVVLLILKIIVLISVIGHLTATISLISVLSPTNKLLLLLRLSSMLSLRTSHQLSWCSGPMSSLASQER